MDDTNFEQFSLNKSQINELVRYLVPGVRTSILYFDDQPINIELPIKMEFKVVESPPGVKGNTASGATKIAKIETGLAITVPLFINVDDKIRIDTRSGEYLERA